MLHSAAEIQAVQAVHGTPALEQALAGVEQALAGLQAALVGRDSGVIERQANTLQQALAAALRLFSQAARQGGLPPELRTRLARAGAQVARQREGLARATAALDRALDVLLPAPTGAAPLYGAGGLPGGRGGLGQAQA